MSEPQGEINVRYMRTTRLVRMSIGDMHYEMTPRDAKTLIDQLREAISESIWDGVDWRYVDQNYGAAIHLAGCGDNQTLCGLSLDKLSVTGFRPLKSNSTLREDGLCERCKRSYAKRAQY